MAFEPITINTQEELDAMFSKRIAKAKEAKDAEYADSMKELETLRGTVSEYAEFKKESEGKLAEMEKSLNEAKTKMAKYESDSAKTRIAHELGLTYESINFITGESEEDIRTSAESLKSLIGNSASVPPLASSEETGNDEHSAYMELARNLK